MAQVRKYAHLLDIDDAPDVYESPEIEDSNQDTARSPSVSDGEGDDADATGVSRSRLQLDQARGRFESSRVDASAADFSDRVAAKKQSYIVSTRRKARSVVNGSEDVRTGSESEGDDDQGLARRVARLNREIAEVKAVLRQRAEKEETQEGTKATSEGDVKNPGPEDITALSRALDSIHESQRQAISAHARLAKQLATPLPSNTLAAPQATQPAAPRESIDEATLSKIASFDARLNTLENSLGLHATDISSDSSIVPILPTLSLLDQQIALLSSPDNVPNLEAKLKTLQTLQSGTFKSTTIKTDDDDANTPSLSAEDITQLRSLYALIPTLSDLGPSVPAILARLRSLRHLHTDAAQASQLLSDLEKRQDETDTELKAWRTGMEKVEEAIQRAEKGFKTNVDEVEKWVQELETKVKDLDTRS
ncbi:Dynamitin-domain-containing protein [Elsinoe ampelina]|uniref:Dynamitin-domain-containing protein n=1 Tax=Elsinoe ampelina TaxID=302913 RepID=A0A6A6G8D0_9PEZI|nr:Dynamitin-domain-containing protein [Elsinoe ampelina]